MVDFTTPNLCGASESFNKLASQFSSIKDSLQDQLEGEIDTLKSELTSSLSVLEADIKGLIPELPDIPDISLISEIQSFLALPAGSLASLNALTSLTSQFGEGLAALGQDLDSIISLASSALSGGIDLCGGTIPNFVIGPDGAVKEKPQDSGIPDKDPAPELLSALKTRAQELAVANVALAKNASDAAVEVTINLPSTDMSSESGNVSIKVRQEYDKIDAQIKAKLEKNGNAPSPQVQKVTNAVAVTSNLPPVKLLKNPDEIIAELKKLQNRISVANNNVKKTGGVLGNMVKKSKNTFPQNILASGTEKLVRNDSKSFRLEVSGLPTTHSLSIFATPTYVKNELSFVGKNHSIKKIATGLWKFYYSSAGLADLAIKNALEANEPRLSGNTQRLKKSLDKITLRVTDLEILSDRFGKIYDEMTNQIEKTYAVPIDEVPLQTDDED